MLGVPSTKESLHHFTTWWESWVKNSSFFELVSHMKGGMNCEYELDIHLTCRQEESHQEHNRNTPGCIFPSFSARKTSKMHFMHLCAPCDIINMKTMPPNGRAHPHLHSVYVWSKSDWQFLRYKHFCILPPFFLIWPLSDHQRHGLRTDSTTTHHPVCPGHH